MEQLNNSLQSLQLQEGRFNTGRGKYAHFIERQINNYLLDAFIYSDIVINSDAELERYGINSTVFQLIYPNWKIVKVGEDGVFVGFEYSE